MDDVDKRNRWHIAVKVFIVVFFVVLAIIVALFHEPWSDEAQSFLIARDNSIAEMFHYAKYEGTTPLWFLIIKFFIVLGGTYETFFLLPLFFTVIGLIIFEFKVKAPWYVKLLLPFTYFIFFQYTIVARSYCLVFPALMWIASIYHERANKRFSYVLSLLVLAGICSYTWLVAGSFLLIDFVKIIRLKAFNKKNIVFVVAMAVLLLLVLLQILPNGDCSFGYTEGPRRTIDDIVYQATISSRGFSTVGKTIIGFLLFECFAAMIMFKKYPSKPQITQLTNLAILLSPLLCWCMVYCQPWHLGIVAIVIFTSFVISGRLGKHLVISVLCVVICLVQISWSVASIKYDLNNNYTAAKEVAEFLKQDDYETVYGLGFDVVAIQPYFEQSIFKNLNTEKAFWFWSDNNGYIENDTLLENDDAIFVLSDFYYSQNSDIYQRLLDKGYNEFHFVGAMFVQDYVYESKGYYILTPTHQNRT